MCQDDIKGIISFLEEISNIDIFFKLPEVNDGFHDSKEYLTIEYNGEKKTIAQNILNPRYAHPFNINKSIIVMTKAHAKTMDLTTLCEALQANMGALKKPRINGKVYHCDVERFQDNLTEWLNLYTNTHKWKKEKSSTTRKEGDSIDIYGKANNGENEWIIEIDATRADQVAKKMLSRFALWALEKDKPITYIVVLYPNTQNGRAECKKFINFGNMLIKKINKKSSVIGVILGKDKRDAENSSILFTDKDYIEIVNPNNKQRLFNITYKKWSTPKPLNGLGACAREAILMYASQKKIKNYVDLSNAFGKYISDEKGPSRYYQTELVLSGKTVHTYTQFRHYSNWFVYLKLCKKLGIIIDELNCYYTRTGFQYGSAYILY